MPSFHKLPPTQVRQKVIVQAIKDVKILLYKPPSYNLIKMRGIKYVNNLIVKGYLSFWGVMQ